MSNLAWLMLKRKIFLIELLTFLQLSSSCYSAQSLMELFKHSSTSARCDKINNSWEALAVRRSCEIKLNVFVSCSVPCSPHPTPQRHFAPRHHTNYRQRDGISSETNEERRHNTPAAGDKEETSVRHGIKSFAAVEVSQYWAFPVFFPNVFVSADVIDSVQVIWSNYRKFLSTRAFYWFFFSVFVFREKAGKF